MGAEASTPEQELLQTAADAKRACAEVFDRKLKCVAALSRRRSGETGSVFVGASGFDCTQEVIEYEMCRAAFTCPELVSKIIEETAADVTDIQSTLQSPETQQKFYEGVKAMEAANKDFDLLVERVVAGHPLVQPAAVAPPENLSECVAIAKQLKECRASGRACEEEIVAFYSCSMSKLCTSEWEPVSACVALGNTVEECLQSLSDDQAEAVGRCSLVAGATMNEYID